MTPVSVLLVDDDPLVRNCLMDWLEDEGFSVSATSSAAEALTVLAAEPFHICISDLNLRGMNGDDFIRETLPAYPLTRFMILTGLHSYCQDTQLRSLGMRDEYVLYKPIFSMKTLSAAIRSALPEELHV